MKTIGFSLGKLVSKKTLTTVVSLLLCAATVFGISISALSLSASVSAVKTEAMLETTGGDAVQNYIPLNRYLRLSYEEPDIPLLMDAAPSTAEITVTVETMEGEPFVGIPFEVTLLLQEEEAEPVVLTDEDCDGILRYEEPAPGVYTITLSPVEGYTVPEPLEVTVEKPIEHKKVDVEVQKPTAQELATEDPGYGQPTKGDGDNPTDTVEFVESTQTVVHGEETKVEVKDENGNTVYVSKPETSEDSEGKLHLILADGTVSSVLVKLHKNGTIKRAYVMELSGVGGPDDDEPGEPGPEPEPQPEPEPEPEPVYVEVDVTSSVITSYGYPVEKNGSYVYKFISVKPKMETVTEDIIVYTGWQVIDGKTYYFDKNGNKVTGVQVIQGVQYTFSSEGVLMTSSGIDVSQWNGSINWSTVRASGVDFVIIRCGLRGSTLGGVFEDSAFRANIAGAKAAGLKVGVYFFTLAATEEQAVIEASACIKVCSMYSLEYPIFMDVEDPTASGAQASAYMALSKAQRTQVSNAFCDTVRNSGYRAGVYANKYWLSAKINTAALGSSTVIWLAHYVNQTDYPGRYEMWQYSPKGSVPGISGDVDMNISYLGY